MVTTICYFSSFVWSGSCNQRFFYEQNCLHGFKSLAHQLPSYKTNMLQPYVPPRSLRSFSENLLAVHRTISRVGSRAFSASAPNLWNSLPLHLCHATSHKQFKKLLFLDSFIQKYLTLSFLFTLEHL